MHHHTRVACRRQRADGSRSLDEIESVAAGVALEAERQLESPAAHLKRAIDAHVRVDITPRRVVVIIVLEGAFNLELDAVEQLTVNADAPAAPREAVLDRSDVVPQQDIGLHAHLRIDADRVAEANRAIVPAHAGLVLLLALGLLSRCGPGQREHHGYRRTE